MSTISLLLGVLLIAMNLIGQLRGAVSGTPAKGRPPVDGYEYRRFPPAVALSRYRSLMRSGRPDIEKIEILSHLVSGSVVHRRYRLTAFDNWLMAAAGALYPELLDTQNARLLWERGAGKCDQASLLMLAKAEELGISGYILGLDGHILVETECGGGRQVIDADRGCFWTCGYDELRGTSKSDLEAAYMTRGFSQEEAEHNARIISESKCVERLRFPPAARRYDIECACNWLVWLLPAAMVVYSVSR